MYPVNRPDIKVCPNENCRLPRYSNEAEIEAEAADADRSERMLLSELRPTRQLVYTSLGKALANLWEDDSKEEILRYGSQMTQLQRNGIAHYHDVYSGEKFHQLLERGVVDENTICVVLFVDGYQLKNMQKAHQVMINCIILNVDPLQR